MYLIRENIIDNELTGYFVDEKISGKLIETHFIDKSLKSCSCRYYAESQNPYGHFHIALVRNWIKLGKPRSALFGKSKNGKIVTLCPGFVLDKQSK